MNTLRLEGNEKNLVLVTVAVNDCRKDREQMTRWLSSAVSVCVGLVVRETKFEPLFDQFFREMDMPAVSTMSQGMNVSVFKSALDG